MHHSAVSNLEMDTPMPGLLGRGGRVRSTMGAGAGLAREAAALAGVPSADATAEDALEQRAG